MWNVSWPPCRIPFSDLKLLKHTIFLCHHNLTHQQTNSVVTNTLTQFGLNKMAYVLQATFSNQLSWMKSASNFTECAPPGDSIDNKSPLAQVMAWHQTGAKPLPKPMMIQFTDIHIYIYIYKPPGLNLSPKRRMAMIGDTFSHSVSLLVMTLQRDSISGILQKIGTVEMAYMPWH